MELDLCAAHGTWFDAHELIALADAMDRKRARDEAKASARQADLKAEVNAVYGNRQALLGVADLFPVTAGSRIVWSMFR